MSQLCFCCVSGSSSSCLAISSLEYIVGQAERSQTTNKPHMWLFVGLLPLKKICPNTSPVKSYRSKGCSNLQNVVFECLWVFRFQLPVVWYGQTNSLICMDKPIAGQAQQHLSKHITSPNSSIPPHHHLVLHGRTNS